MNLSPLLCGQIPCGTTREVSSKLLLKPNAYGRPIYRVASTHGLENFIVQLNVAYDAGIHDRHVNMSPLYIYYRNIMLLALYVLTL